MKTNIIYIVLGLFCCCGAIAQNTKFEFTDEEIQADLNSEAQSSVSNSRSIIEYCWRQKKIEFLKQYMVSKHFGHRAYMVSKMKDQERQKIADQKLNAELILHALQTDSIWIRPAILKPSEPDQFGYETQFKELIRIKFQDLILKEMNEPSERKLAIIYIEKALGKRVGENGENKEHPTSSKRRPPRLSEDDAKLLHSSSKRKQPTSEQNDVPTKDIAVKYWVIGLAAFLCCFSLWVYLKRRR